jgi:hypothetical protein
LNLLPLVVRLTHPVANDVTVLIADAHRLAALRDGFHLPGRVLRFSNGNLPSAFESIRGNQPGAVVLDAGFAQTPEGRAFVHRVEQLSIPDSEIRVVEFANGVWTATPLGAKPAAPIPVPHGGLNTRRAPRFLALDPRQAVVEGATASLVDLSVLGAQVVSKPLLRPNQKIKVALPDSGETLALGAHVAWSLFEKPKQEIEPYYRAGMEFDDATTKALEDYCKRHCAGNPLPERR